MSLEPIQPTPAPGKQPDSTEAPPPAPVEAAPKEDLLAPKLAQMAKKEKALRDAQRALLAEKEQLQAKLQEEQRSWTDSFKAKLLQDPVKILSEAGLNYDQLTQAFLNQGDPNDLKHRMLQEEIRQLKAAQDKAAEDARKATQDQADQIKKQMRNEVVQLIAADENFETIKAMSAEDAVVELIEQTFNQDGVLMNVADAAKEVEAYLFEQALGWMKLKKIQAKLAPAPQPETPKEESPKQSQPTTSTTLSNRMTASGAPTNAKNRRERAIAAFMGKQIS